MAQRLDAYLVARGLIKSRERAKLMIKNGGVTVNGRVITKAAFAVSEQDEITCEDDPLSFVGRGGLKLEHAFRVFSPDVTGCAACDIGASTGGFTQCLLMHGAKKVYAVDVGHGQLDESLVSDDRVVNMEGVNARELTPSMFDEAPGFICGDLSFISLRLVIDAMTDILADEGEMVLLIKPQFEAGRGALGKKGIVRDRKDHIRVIEELTALFIQKGLSVRGLTGSSVKGSDGNIEYLVYLKKDGAKTGAAFSAAQTVKDTFESFRAKHEGS
ncbi:MAG: TlyA family RNA methyltransferase [Ruminococcus sp.]|nr:TlyA family RNA methyltransferase [Ruminococcus sp.]